MSGTETETFFIRSTRILRQLWDQVLSEPEDSPVDSEIDNLVNSNTVAIRYCLPTQLLGKMVNPGLDCLCLQKGNGTDPAMWDPRGFASSVIVPWITDNQNVLGNSADPYVGKPLRKPRLEENPTNVRPVSEWQNLYRVLSDVQNHQSQEYTREKFLLVLRSIHKRLRASIFEYNVPTRVSLEQTRKIIRDFLAESSGGDRGLSVAAALFQTFGEYFHLYTEVNRSVINASDQSTGQVGDIECIGENGEIRLGIEVKERNLTLVDVRSAVQKARRQSLQEYLFNVPATDPGQNDNIVETVKNAWASGTNIYRHNIDELISVGLTLTGEHGRRTFLQYVGKQLDEYNTQPSNRIRWKELLERL